MMQNYSGCLNTDILHTLWGVCVVQSISRTYTVPETCVCFLVFKATGKRGGLYLILLSFYKIVEVVTFEYGHLKPACAPWLHKLALGAQVTLYIHWPRTEKPPWNKLPLSPCISATLSKSVRWNRFSVKNPCCIYSHWKIHMMLFISCTNTCQFVLTICL